MRAIKSALVACLALLAVPNGATAPFALATARAETTVASADATPEERVPGPLRPVSPVPPIAATPDRTRPGQPPRAQDPAPRRPLAKQPAQRLAPSTWSATLVPGKRGGEAKGKVVATVASHELKLTDFAVADRPALEIWLIAADPATPAANLLETKHVSLGRLRKPRGDQVYRFPAELDLAIYRTVLVWSRRDRAPDAVARLNPTRVD